MSVKLYDYQREALRLIKPGSIVLGGVGSGKTLVTLAYYITGVCGGKVRADGELDLSSFKQKVPLVVITTAAKRDTEDWIVEASRAGIKNLTVDSWNNLKKYSEVTGSFFIFDEQKTCGRGTWAKEFIKIARRNPWVIATATPGDTWSDYASVFIANGFYKGFSDFNMQHVVYAPFVKYPKIARYIGIEKLIANRDRIVVKLRYKTPTVHHYELVHTPYDENCYAKAVAEMTNPYTGEPIVQKAELCYILRRVGNSTPERVSALAKILEEHPKLIVFYNFDYELELIKELSSSVLIHEYNGHKHEPVPEGDRWIYAVAYAAWGEGNECRTTNTIVFFSMTYSYKMMVQASGRIDRNNTPYKDLYYYILYSKSPIDLSILSCLKRKKVFNENDFVEKLQKKHSL